MLQPNLIFSRIPVSHRSMNQLQAWLRQFARGLWRFLIFPFMGASCEHRLRKAKKILNKKKERNVGAPGSLFWPACLMIEKELLDAKIPRNEADSLFCVTELCVVARSLARHTNSYCSLRSGTTFSSIARARQKESMWFENYDGTTTMYYKGVEITTLPNVLRFAVSCSRA